MPIQGSSPLLQGGRGISLQRTRTGQSLQPTVGHSINQTPVRPPAPPPQVGLVESATRNNPYQEAQAQQAQQAAAAAAAARADEQAFWQDQMGVLQGQLGRTNTTLNQGRANISDSFNQQRGRANEQQGQVLRNYGIKRQDTETGRTNALGQVDSGARTLYNNLQRIIGMGGGGVSSAAQEVAPWAVSRDATQKRTGVQDTFGRNTRDIGLAEDDAKSQFSRLIEDLVSQRRNKEQQLEGDVEDQRININEQLANAATQKAIAGGASYTSARGARAPFTANINAGQSRLDQLFDRFRNPTYDVKPVNARVPNLANYIVDNTRLQPEGAEDYSQDVSAYLPFLKRDERRLV